MVTMTVEQIGIYTAADLERERDRDDRLRWELLDGELAMTPAPRPLHQEIVLELAIRLRAVLGPSVRVLVAPVDVHLDDRSILQPDLILAARADLTDDGLRGAPLLAVEILSPATRRRDLVTKRELLERAGCPHYWVIDPDEVSVRIWELVAGAYVGRTYATGDQQVTVSQPVELTFRPQDLLPPPA